ncbi:LacI family DNA-binding transcriptional regulator [Actinocatenispora rupis]|uniref:LacI family transcriptional regulator n=1 Tax=Actinocatenispora rupis TaxID=519421 RepID=A0A8J3J459_9ACTN|nr:LacI family DNA-binding transcriptional regulator [Actinocatenispora rupis]GID15461.1 LacI family transcriptional regulator [Actinocatenispora rupis]
MGLRRKHVTIAEVAARAGVSPTTVSHVLSGRRHVAEATRAQVLAVVEELQYRPNELARSMVTQRTSTIALIIPDITNPFYPAVARGLQDVLTPAGYYGIVCNTDGDPAIERRTVEQMVHRRVDGIGFAGYYQHQSTVAPALAAGIPVVLFGSRDARRGIDAVTANDLGGAESATRYLLDRGYERIGFVTGPAGDGPPALRVTGYRRALRAAGRRPDPKLVVRAPFSRDGGAAGMAELLALPRPPRAVLCTNDVVAIGAMDEARRRGLRIPEDVAVVGFDDIDAASLAYPALSTVAVPAREEGRACGRLLLHRLTDEPQQPPQAVSFDCTLVPRDSA